MLPQSILGVTNEHYGVAVKLYNTIWKVLGLNIGRDSGYPEKGSSWFSCIPPGKSGKVFRLSFNNRLNIQPKIVYISEY
jgi:hypothetical protein